VSEARRALQLDSTLAETYQALAVVTRRTDFDWPRTIEASRRALALNPSLELPHYTLAAAYYHLGLFDLAEREVRAGREANPTGDLADATRTRGVTAFFRGDYASAVSSLKEVSRLSGQPVSDAYLAQVYFYHGDTARAEGLLSELLESTSASARARAAAELASFLAARGERSRARALIRRVETGDYFDHHVAYSLGAAHGQLGEPAAARAWLARAAAIGFPCYPWFARDPLLAPLRQDAGFRRFLDSLRAEWERARATYER
jgi:tetratricopeptide (TPR) repeat protein